MRCARWAKSAVLYGLLTLSLSWQNATFSVKNEESGILRRFGAFLVSCAKLTQSFGPQNQSRFAFMSSVWPA